MENKIRITLNSKRDLSMNMLFIFALDYLSTTSTKLLLLPRLYSYLKPSQSNVKIKLNTNIPQQLTAFPVNTSSKSNNINFT